MKINIGPYRQDLVPVRRWERNYEHFRSDSFYHDEMDWKWFDKVVYKTFDVLSDVFAPINKWSNNRSRKVKIKYDPYDTWSLDHTLALIILPGLKQLKATNHGCPQVANEDLPTACLKDASAEERWEWVMDEMIWTFEEIANEYPGEEAFYSGDLDFVRTKVDVHGNENPEGNLYRMDKGPNHTFNVDFEARKKYDERIQRGLILFGKYYRNLWD
jgi:hypothetical protein